MPDNNGPTDPFLPDGLIGARKAMYELYASAVQAGFTETQSMQLVTSVFTTMMSKAISKND
jgi:hypothetical protein